MIGIKGFCLIERTSDSTIAIEKKYKIRVRDIVDHRLDGCEFE